VKIRVWLAARERETYIVAAEVLVLALVLITGPATWVRVLVGLPLLGHLGYHAITSLPIGALPGRPEGQTKQRRNQELRSHVAAFLHQVRRLEEYAQRAKVDGRPLREVEHNLLAAERTMMAAAADLVKAAGRSTASAEAEVSSGAREINVFAPSGKGAAGR
jgi:hypothetical protein